MKIEIELTDLDLNQLAEKKVRQAVEEQERSYVSHQYLHDIVKKAWHGALDRLVLEAVANHEGMRKQIAIQLEKKITAKLNAALRLADKPPQPEPLVLLTAHVNNGHAWSDIWATDGSFWTGGYASDREPFPVNDIIAPHTEPRKPRVFSHDVILGDGKSEFNVNSIELTDSVIADLLKAGSPEVSAALAEKGLLPEAKP